MSDLNEHNCVHCELGDELPLVQSSLCNKLHSAGYLPHWFLFIIFKAENGENNEYNTTQHLFFIEGGFIDWVAYWVFRPTPGKSFFHI